MRGTHGARAAGGIAFGLGLLLLLARMGADPPLVSWSIDAFGDPGHYLHNARSIALFGDPDPDAGHAPYVAPGFFVLTTAVFTHLGVGLLQARLVDLLAWALAGAAVVRAARERAVPAAATLVLLSVSLLAAARAPKGDTLAAAALAGGVSFLLEPDTRRDRLFVGGLLVGLAPFFKLHTVLPAAGALAGFVAAEAAAVRLRRLRSVGLGLIVAATVWSAYLLDLHAEGALDRGLSVARGVIGSVGIAGAGGAGLPFDPVRIMRSNLWVREPVLAALGLLALASFVAPGAPAEPAPSAPLRRFAPPTRRVRWTLLGAFLVPAAVLSLTPYDPPRYRLALVPLLGIAASCAGPAGARAGAAAGAAFGIALGDWIAGKADSLGAGRWPVLLAAVVAGAAAGAFLAPRASLRRIEAFVLAGLVLAGFQAVWIFGRAGRELETAARAMEAAVPPDAVLAGFWAPNLALWTNHRVSLTFENPGLGHATHLVEEDALLPRDIALERLGEADLPTIRRRIGFYRIVRTGG